VSTPATIPVSGDSLTDDVNGWGTPGHYNWVYLLMERLITLGHNVVTRDFAIGGQNSQDRIASLHQMRYYADPIAAILMIGANDNGQGIPQPQSQANIETWCLALKHGVMGKATKMPNGDWANTDLGSYSVNTTLSSALSTGGGAIAALPITGPVVSTIPAGTVVTIASGGNSQSWTVSSPVALGAVALTVTPQTPNFAYPSGSAVTSVGGTTVVTPSALPPAQGAALSGTPSTSIAGSTGDKIGAKYVVLNDNDGTGGTDALPGDTRITSPTITGSVGGVQSVWQRTNHQAGPNGWHRIAVASTAPTACKKLVIVSTQYKNGDNAVTCDTPSTPEPIYATIRAAQQAAVASQNVNDANGNPTVVYADLYGFTRAQIIAGKIPNFSADSTLAPSVAYDPYRDPHAQKNNQHPGIGGQDLTYQPVYGVMSSAGWLSTPLAGF
jgi:hypothetical protein